MGCIDRLTLHLWRERNKMLRLLGVITYKRFQVYIWRLFDKPLWVGRLLINLCKAAYFVKLDEISQKVFSSISRLDLRIENYNETGFEIHQSEKELCNRKENEMKCRRYLRGWDLKKIIKMSWASYSTPIYTCIM